MTGALRYSSINSQIGFEQSRRDDLESIGYMMIYFIKGSLPWQNITAKDKDDKYRNVLKSKLETSTTSLCMGLPDEFETYMNYVRSLDYEAEPNYYRLRKMFNNLYKKKEYENNIIFE